MISLPPDTMLRFLIPCCLPELNLIMPRLESEALARLPFERGYLEHQLIPRDALPHQSLFHHHP
jgi:hypothetical protein